MQFYLCLYFRNGDDLIDVWSPGFVAELKKKTRLINKEIYKKSNIPYISGSFCIIAATSNLIVLEYCFSGKGGGSFWMICLMTACIWEGEQKNE